MSEKVTCEFLNIERYWVFSQTFIDTQNISTFEMVWRGISLLKFSKSISSVYMCFMDTM